MAPLDRRSVRAACSRRAFLQGGALGLGAMALRGLDDRSLGQGPRRTVPSCKSVIYLHMEGAPSPLDMFDPKPELFRHDGKKCPDAFLQQERFAFIKGHPKLLAPRYGFKKCGPAGVDVVELLPHVQQVMGDLLVVKSLHTDQFNHAPAELLLFSGSPRIGRPAMGSWVWYGLGSENANLPGFVVLVSGTLPSAGKSLWGSGFLPSSLQGVQLRGQGDPILFLQDPDGVDRAARRRMLDAAADLGRMGHEAHGDPETLARIAQHELAFRMQMEAPEAVDLGRESAETLALYGAEPGKASFANNCLLARRLVERGVRFVQLYDSGWDLHGTGPGDDLMTQFPKKCRELDRPLAGLITDLRRRGMLEDTLVVWGGEFGRTPMNEERNGSTFLGRDHHPHCFTVLMAGGGCKAGAVVGATDELGHRIAETPIHVHDLQATILYMLGLDHEQLTYRHEGRDFRLTDVAGKVRGELLA
jgi:hypothetical protein